MELWAVRRNNPLILSCADGSSYLASHIPAILRYSKSIMRLADDEIACLKAGAVISYDKSGTEKSVKFEDVPWNFEMAGYITPLSAMFLVAAALAHSKGNITDAFARNFLNVLSNDVPAAISNVISRRSEIVMLAKEIVDKNDLYFIGRGCDYAASIESPLS